MIRGAPHWNDRNYYYVQTNNPTETILKKIRFDDWLESCGPTAAVNCIAALGYDVLITCPGEYRPQPEEVLTDFFNDPVNAQKLKQIRDIDYAYLPKNRVPQLYPYAIEKVFDVPSFFKWTNDFSDIADCFYVGKTVQLCLENPGHYIAVVAYDEDSDELIYNDSWPDRFKDGNGFNRRLSQAEHKNNVKPYAVIYGSTV